MKNPIRHNRAATGKRRFSINVPIPSAPTQSTPDLWQQIQPGAYACCFRSLWKLDYGRTYQRIYQREEQADDSNAGTNAPDYGKSPRPILINLWYPISGEQSGSPMFYGDYLHIPSENPKVSRFSEELAAYARDITVQGAFSKKEPELNTAEQEALTALMQTPTAAYRNLLAAEERFPLLLYHMGAGSSFQNNTVMCEYLASHGYVVISSAFQKNDGSSLNTDGERPAADIAFLLSYAQGLPFVDWSHVGMIGHSAGAHAAIIYQTLPGCAVDAAVCLDTTEDYFALVQPGWETMRKAVKGAIPRLTRPMLFAAGSWAGFEMVETMTATPRYLYTVSAMGHDGYVTDGPVKKWIAFHIADEDAREAAQTEAEVAWERYGALCETVREFLDASLKGHREALGAHVARDQERAFSGVEPYLAAVPAGADGPEPYVENVDNSDSGDSCPLPPSPRQVLQILRTRGATAVVAALSDGTRLPTWIETTQDHYQYPAYNERFVYKVVYQLMALGHVDDAQTLYDRYNRFAREAGWPPFWSMSLFFLNYGKLFKDPKCFEFLLALEPGNEEAARELNLLRASEPS